MFNKHIEKLINLSMKYKNNAEFSDTLKHKITIITNLLLNGLKEGEYTKIVNKICSYLR